jgi:hypothetical protein
MDLPEGYTPENFDIFKDEVKNFVQNLTKLYVIEVERTNNLRSNLQYSFELLK